MKHALLLGCTFFQRFFESDLMPPGLPQVQLVVGALTMLAAPGLLLPMRFAAKYEMLVRRDVGALQHALVADRLLFVTITMVGLGLVALVIWDGVFRYTTPILESLAFETPRVLLLYLGFAAATIIGFRVIRARRLRALPGFRFQEEDPERMFQGFNLSEGLAAQTGVRPR